MIIDRDNQVQTALFAVLEAALPGITVTAEPTVPGERFVRIDSFIAVDNELYKSSEATTHSFTVHVFDQPDGGALTLTWVRQTLSAIDQAVMSASLAGGRARRQEAQALFEPTSAEGVNDAHGFIRYSVQIGA